MTTRVWTAWVLIAMAGCAEDRVVAPTVEDLETAPDDPEPSPPAAIGSLSQPEPAPTPPIDGGTKVVPPKPDRDRNAPTTPASPPAVRVWSDVGGGRVRNLTNLTIEDLTYQGYTGSSMSLGGTISAITNTTDAWVSFGTKVAGAFGRGDVLCVGPGASIPRLTAVSGERCLVTRGDPDCRSRHVDGEDWNDRLWSYDGRNPLPTDCDLVVR